LKDNLHRFIFESESFPRRPKQAILEGFQKAENEFLTWAGEHSEVSGSCAIVVMLIGEKCYVANTGDSRAVVSSHRGKKVARITKDHKPDDPVERERVIQAGGSVVTHNYPVINSAGVRVGANISRIVPGNIAVSRSFGDLDLKSSGLLIHVPEIRSFRLTVDFDFILMASDGVFDKLEDRDACDYVWKAFEREGNLKDRICSAVEDVMKYAIIRGSEDNVTTVLICFKGLQEMLESSVNKDR
jgi:protein phosphatase 2C family protein 2/3